MQTQMALFLGLVLLAGGQPGQDSSPSDKPAPVAKQVETPEVVDASCCEPCCPSCGSRCGHESVCCWMIREMCLGPLFHGDCNMVPHAAYFPELHGYYYFRPYHFSHIRLHQEFVSSFGEDPRAPYANTVFQQVYRQLQAKPSGSHRLRAFPHATGLQQPSHSGRPAIRPVSLHVFPSRKAKHKPVLSRKK